MHRNSQNRQNSTMRSSKNNQNLDAYLTPKAMPSGQRISHYKDFISGLKPVNFNDLHQPVRHTYNHSSLHNESYATAITSA